MTFNAYNFSTQKLEYLWWKEEEGESVHSNFTVFNSSLERSALVTRADTFDFDFWLRRSLPMTFWGENKILLTSLEMNDDNEGAN